jgi:hypothetical protein
MEVSGQLHAPAALHLGRELPFPVVEETWWAPEPVWTLWSREKFLPAIEPRSSSPYPVALPTELSRLLYHLKSLLPRASSKRFLILRASNIKK